MTILFGTLGDGGTIRSFVALAACASVGATAIGVEAERYAQRHRAVLSLTPGHGSEAGGLSQLRLNGVDYRATGALEPEGRRGGCGGIADPR